MKTATKILLVFTTSVVVACFTLIYHIFSKPPRNIETEVPGFVMDANELHSEFSFFQETTTLRYANSVIRINGIIAEITREENSVTITFVDVKNGIDCALSTKAISNNQDIINKLAPGDHICLKGKCDGVDMIMGVVLTNCYICN